MAQHSKWRSWWTSAMASSVALLSLAPTAANATTYIEGTDANGVTRILADNRYPALYTGDFTDCLGGESLMNVTTFDAAYYADNMTVLFHLQGTTSLKNESIMAYISVDAYGEDRFDLTFNPCAANIASLCPLNNSVPIVAGPIIPVGPSDVAGIPALALTIPDFEGSATLRLFSNSTKTEIACFQAIMTNGNTISHPAAVGGTVGAFVAIAVIASFATAIYGATVPEIRTHYAHSLSVLVVFEVFHSVFFTGAMSMDWPSVCAAWWSNFAWTAGMIYSPKMQHSINEFAGQNLGNTSQVGGAGSDAISNAGGLQQQIYGRAPLKIWSRSLDSYQRGNRMVNNIINKRSSNNHTASYGWGGVPEPNGLPLPGDWSSFAGELFDLDIPVSNAFLTGLIWFLALFACLIVAVVLFKYTLEGLSAIKFIKQDRLALFRNNWLLYLGMLLLRTALIAFFMMMTLTLYQLSLGGSSSVLAIAAIIFIIFFMGMFSVAAYACYFRLRLGKYESNPDRIHFQQRKILKVIPWFKMRAASNMEDEEKKGGSLPFFRVDYLDNDAERKTVHEDEEWNKRFGWLSARYRRTRWWFFPIWLIFQFLRACFLGGAKNNPKAQVGGLLFVEVVALVSMAWLKPYESRRNMAVGVYLIGISRIVVLACSITLLPSMNFPRISATIVGFVIIIAQGVLIIALLILITLGAISSYMSIMRNREDFRPRKWAGIRVKYFKYLDQKATDLPPPPPPTPPTPPPEPVKPEGPYFSVNSVRRAPKIEDEDEDYLTDLEGSIAGTVSQPRMPGRSRANSARSTHSGFGALPIGARPHRASWSSRDFSGSYQENGFSSRPPSISYGALPAHMLRAQHSNTNIYSSATLSDSLVEEPEQTEGKEDKPPFVTEQARASSADS